jgi:alkanesulfonate monooxygenase SsuD/methylene tetrahydromethanopterin reductase-like flavin-dependent oxidoreductase (luciferase family)
MDVVDSPGPPGNQYGVAFWSGETPARLVTLAQRAEDLGYDSFWLAEYYHYRALGPLAAVVGNATERIMVGLGVLPTHSRHPGLIAMEAVALDEICDGRLVLGLGAGQTAALRHSRSAGPGHGTRSAGGHDSAGLLAEQVFRIGSPTASLTMPDPGERQ